MCIWDCESRTFRADRRSSAERREGARRVGCWQREAGCENGSADSEGPSTEIGLACADMPRAAAAAKFEVSRPANRSASASCAAAQMDPLLLLPARLRLSRCQVRLGEYPPPVSFIHRDGRLLERDETRRCQTVACRQTGRGSLCHVPHSSMSRRFSQPLFRKILQIQHPSRHAALLIQFH